MTSVQYVQVYVCKHQQHAKYYLDMSLAVSSLPVTSKETDSFSPKSNAHAPNSSYLHYIITCETRPHTHLLLEPKAFPADGTRHVGVHPGPRLTLDSLPLTLG